MMRLSWGLAALVFSFVFFATGTGDSARADDAEPRGEKFSLRYRFQPGETIRWEVVHRAKIKTTVSGTTQTAETVSQSVKAWRIKDVLPDGTTTLEHLVESVDMRHKLTGSRREVRYNSQTDEKPPVGYEGVAQSIGVPIATVTVNARGEVLKRERNELPATAQNEQGQITVPMPEGPVAVGESWSFPYEIKVPLGTGAFEKKVKTVQKFTLAAVNTGVATIEVATQILTPIQDPALEAQLIQRAAAGTVRFDVDAGRILGQQMDVDKVVVGFRGEASSLHYLSRFTEDLLGAQTKTAGRQPTTSRD